jgi:hypothetical protein
MVREIWVLRSSCQYLKGIYSVILLQYQTPPEQVSTRESAFSVVNLLDLQAEHTVAAQSTMQSDRGSGTLHQDGPTQPEQKSDRLGLDRLRLNRKSSHRLE